jgi:hypothetical protein
MVKKMLGNTELEIARMNIADIHATLVYNHAVSIMSGKEPPSKKLMEWAENPCYDENSMIDYSGLGTFPWYKNEREVLDMYLKSGKRGGVGYKYNSDSGKVKFFNTKKPEMSVGHFPYVQCYDSYKRGDKFSYEEQLNSSVYFNMLKEVDNLGGLAHGSTAIVIQDVQMYVLMCMYLGSENVILYTMNEEIKSSLEYMNDTFGKDIPKIYVGNAKNITSEFKEIQQLYNMTKITNIIMNPPYDGALHIKFLKVASGIGENWIDVDNVVSVQPSSWLYNQRNKSDGEKIRDEFISANINFHKIEFFNGNDIFHISNQTPLAIITIGKEFSNIYISQSHWGIGTTKSTVANISKINPFMDDRTSLYNSIKSTIQGYANEKNLNDVISRKSENDWNVPISYIAGAGKSVLFTSSFYNCVAWSVVDKDGLMDKNTFEKQQYIVDPITKKRKEKEECKLTPIFNSKQEAVNFAAYLKRDIVIFCMMMYKDTQNIGHGNIPKYIPFMDDYTQPWTDDRIYQHMGFNQEEISYIQEMVNRWKAPS